jgi:hypothetical protein
MPMSDVPADDNSLIGGTETVLMEPPGTHPVNRHQPVRPVWTCVVDNKPWPCPSARVYLRTAYANDRAGLAVYMSQELTAAAIDMADNGTLPPGLFHRFLTWT